jgi:FkbH-like protein
LRGLAKELGLGLDSVIFVDDSPVECAEVEAGSSEVLTLLLPEEAEIPTWLKHVWAFDHVKRTAEDARRTELYRENTQRESLRQQSYSLEEFLASLQIEIKINAMAAEDAVRVAQLTQRTNQFNTTTVRRSEAELQHFLNSPGAACSVVRVRDRFGDYGLVGAMMFTAGGKLTVESMMLSCRALGRRVEHAMLAHLAEVASERRMDRIDVLYRPSERNAPVREFLESIAADFKAPQGDGSVYRVPRVVAANAGQALAATAKGKE